MRDEDDGLAQIAPQREQIVVQPKTGDLVEGGERLIHQQDIRIGDQCARQRTRIFMPPDNSRGKASANSVNPTCVNASAMRAFASVAGACASFNGNRTFSRTLAHGISVGS